jgi:mono/diheme cytochrome c family protein
MKKEIILLTICSLLSGCGGGGSESNTDTNVNTFYQPATTTGRLLAANCFQCHGTNGTGGFERITGGEASEVYDYLTQTANTDIMAAHAQGYSAEQLNALIGYLNQIPR